ncbi:MULTISPECIES: galactokinase [Marinimicrobium]|uniref:galactokinase n=1 Tax=Marinimicrobium TaxID=359337 RepID=UPI0004168F7D|nr:galactokinase [Marinimicrobium agarilyticum]
MINRVTEQFQTLFKRNPDFSYFAPGRVNLIGEHTDYNDGFVFPCAIEYGTYMAVGKRSDSVVRVVAGNFSQDCSEWSLTDDIVRSEDSPWSNYLRGVCVALQEKGHTLSGLDVYVEGNVPRGAGLSSSASLSVAFAGACSEANGLQLDVTTQALVAQQAENDFAGCSCGIMDQLASAGGQEGRALLIDCQSLTFDRFPIPEALTLMIIDSRVERQLVGSEYNDRRADCERAAEHLQVKSLRGADMTLLNQHKGQLDDLAYRRARHVISENERTVAAAQALASADYQTLNAMMKASHVSMRDDFEITIPEIDFIVSTVEQHLEEDGGVRMTGGGFGGCVVALVPNNKAHVIKEQVTQAYAQEYGRDCKVYMCYAAQGARVL